MLFNDSIYIDGPFQVISGSHVLDLNNRIFDKMIPFLRANKLTSFTEKKILIIFDGRILHRRLFSTKGGKINNYNRLRKSKLKKNIFM